MDKHRLTFDDLCVGGVYFSESKRERYKITRKDIMPVGIDRGKPVWFAKTEIYGPPKRRSIKETFLTIEEVNNNFFH